jgi:hypothetical protein
MLAHEDAQARADEQGGRFKRNTFEIGDSVYVVTPSSQRSKLELPAAYGPLRISGWDSTQARVALAVDPQDQASVLRVHVLRLVRKGELPEHLQVRFVEFASVFPAQGDQSIVQSARPKADGEAQLAPAQGEPQLPPQPAVDVGRTAVAHQPGSLGLEQLAEPAGIPELCAQDDGQQVTDPGQVAGCESGHYEVEDIARHEDYTDRKGLPGVRYLVKWKGYLLQPDNEEDWVDAEEIQHTAPTVVEDYEARQQAAQRERIGSRADPDQRR